MIYAYGHYSHSRKLFESHLSSLERTGWASIYYANCRSSGCEIFYTLGFAWDEVHEIAEQLEHIESEKLVNCLDDFLGNPKVDPHGDPIPDKDGVMDGGEHRLLATLSAGEKAVVVRVTQDEPSFLNFLSQQGLHLQTQLQVSSILDFDDSMILQVNDRLINISSKVASHIYVRSIS